MTQRAGATRSGSFCSAGETQKPAVVTAGFCARKEKEKEKEENLISKLRIS